MKQVAALCGAIMCGVVATAAGAADEPLPATTETAQANAAALRQAPFADRRDYDDVARGFIAPLTPRVIEGADGRPVWDAGAYDFTAGDAPDTVNPSLWRQAQLNAKAGLFKVTDGVYQLRGLDLSNMTVIEGGTGLIIIDPLTTVETAKAALGLYYQHRPKKPVVAVIYSHSHADHFGGVKGVVDEADVAAGKVKIFAPEGFMAAAVKENVLVGNAMSRRAQYQFGLLLAKNARGEVDAGIGKAVPNGHVSLIPPTDVIHQAEETRLIDGVKFVFLNTPETEAPSEMVMYLPQHHLLDIAEIATKTLHNLLPLRGAAVRNADLWSKDLDLVLDRFGGDSEVMVAQHSWPTWGREAIGRILSRQRDEYRFINDQTIRLINHGYGPQEIAEKLRLPDSLAGEWSAHGYYGSVAHDSQAVYQRMIGWYDGNPADLSPLPRRESARHAIAYMGGAAEVLKRAQADYAKGDYRWVAQVANQLVMADPSDREARSLEADALEQLGYQAESSTWRNAYLSAAMELRNGVPPQAAITSASADVVAAMPLDLFFDYLGVRLDAAHADGKHAVINWHFTDVGQDVALTLENSALTHRMGRTDPAADLSLTLSKATLDAVLLGRTTFPAAMQGGLVQVQGDPRKLAELMGMLETFPTGFPIVEPVAE